ncbi:MAG: FHA domain-containing protein, partial [Thermoguttaceae bacterium]
RSRQADVTVAHPLISRRHCEISENNGLLMLRDLASLNGTMIGGRRIELAPLLPDREFTIGPLTFRVLYKYSGDLESVPAPRFVGESKGITEASLGDPTSAGAEESPKSEVDGTLPAESPAESHSGELAMPSLMALADADIEEVLPPARALSRQAPPAFPTGSLWPPPVAVDKLPTTPMTGVLDEPMEADSSSQPGGRRKESPWGVEPPTVERAWSEPPDIAGKGAPAQPGVLPEPILAENENVAEPPANEKPSATNPPPAELSKRPNYGDEIYPEFGSFLEGLQ